MKTITHAIFASVAALALSACGSSDSAGEDATAETVEVPADEAMADASAMPEADASANASAAPAGEASDAAATATDEAAAKM
jgi:hypothetical protein